MHNLLIWPEGLPDRAVRVHYRNILARYWYQFWLGLSTGRRVNTCRYFQVWEEPAAVARQLERFLKGE